MINAPLFCITADAEWASEYALEDFLLILAARGIKPTLFATHASPLLEKAFAEGAIELGVHPNFLPGSTHGADIDSVIEHICGLFPQATTFRSHCFCDSTPIARQMYSRGFRYDSNLCLYMQPHLVPLRHSSGLSRFPVFWEDDLHWEQADSDWNFDRYSEAFFSPGLKVINVHPFNIAANVSSKEHYLQVKPHIRTLTAAGLNRVRFDGPGSKTFLLRLLDRAAERQTRFYTLGELYRLVPPPQTARDDTQGRQTEHTDEEYRRYWRMSDTGKQEFLKESFKRRESRDPYATSRDTNLRELEILSIRKHLRRKGRVLDLGCGNGYTLISLARNLSELEMIGVDFVDDLIKGANELLRERMAELRSHPTFICADAVEYIKNCASASVDFVITERFLLNLPSVQWQEQVIREAFRALVPGGRFLMCESSDNGFSALNEIRAAVGLPAIAGTSKDNISSVRFNDAQIERFAGTEVGFSLKAKEGFSVYFLMSRVLHPLMVMPQQPRFDSRINALSRQIQENLPFRSGHGSNVLWVFEKPAPGGT